MTSAPPHESVTLPGWYGKLPGAGDFAHRRCAADWRLAWDGWLQTELADWRTVQADWAAHYCSAPLWGFVLGEGVLGAHPWRGVLMPSMDRVGRYFPLTVVAPGLPVGEAMQVPTGDWWGMAAAAALQALREDLDAEAFEQALAAHFAAPSGHAAPAGGLAVPAPGHSGWQALPGGPVWHGQGLPRGPHFASLFTLQGVAPAAPQPEVVP